MSDESKKFHLESLTVSGFKGCHFAALNPQKPLTFIGGENEQGKSSFLEGLSSLLERKAALAEVPVNREDSESKIFGVFTAADGTKIKATKVISKEGVHKFKIESETGPFSSPQAVAEKLFGKTLDPMAFAKSKPADQAEMIRGILGLDFTDHDQKRKQTYDARTAINREATRIKGALDKLPAYLDVPPEEVPLIAPPEVVEEVKADLISIWDLTEELEAARLTNKIKMDAEDHCIKLEQDIKAETNLINELETKLQAAKAKKDNLTERLLYSQKDYERLPTADETSIRSALAKAEESNKSAQAEADRLNRIARAEATERSRAFTAAAQATNEKVRANKERAKLAAELAEVSHKSEGKTRELESLDNAKASILAAHPLPVPGLEFDGESVTYKGLPFSEKQLSSAEIRTISCLLAFETAKQLKVLVVKDGAFLDKKHRELVGSLAEEHGFQVLMEIVGEEGADIVIEGGFQKKIDKKG